MPLQADGMPLLQPLMSSKPFASCAKVPATARPWHYAASTPTLANTMLANTANPANPVNTVNPFHRGPNRSLMTQAQKMDENGDDCRTQYIEQGLDQGFAGQEGFEGQQEFGGHQGFPSHQLNAFHGRYAGGSPDPHPCPPSLTFVPSTLTTPLQALRQSFAAAAPTADFSAPRPFSTGRMSASALPFQIGPPRPVPLATAPLLSASSAPKSSPLVQRSSAHGGSVQVAGAGATGAGASNAADADAPYGTKHSVRGKHTQCGNGENQSPRWNASQTARNWGADSRGKFVAEGADSARPISGQRSGPPSLGEVGEGSDAAPDDATLSFVADKLLVEWEKLKPDCSNGMPVEIFTSLFDWLQNPQSLLAEGAKASEVSDQQVATASAQSGPQSEPIPLQDYLPPLSTTPLSTAPLSPAPSQVWPLLEPITSSVGSEPSATSSADSLLTLSSEAGHSVSGQAVGTTAAENENQSFPQRISPAPRLDHLDDSTSSAIDSSQLPAPQLPVSRSVDQSTAPRRRMSQETQSFGNFCSQDTPHEDTLVYALRPYSADQGASALAHIRNNQTPPQDSNFGLDSRPSNIALESRTARATSLPSAIELGRGLVSPLAVPAVSSEKLTTEDSHGKVHSDNHEHMLHQGEVQETAAHRLYACVAESLRRSQGSQALQSLSRDEAERFVERLMENAAIGEALVKAIPAETLPRLFQVTAESERHRRGPCENGTEGEGSGRVKEHGDGQPGGKQPVIANASSAETGTADILSRITTLIDSDTEQGREDTQPRRWSAEQEQGPAFVKVGNHPGFHTRSHQERDRRGISVRDSRQTSSSESWSSLTASHKQCEPGETQIRDVRVLRDVRDARGVRDFDNGRRHENGNRDGFLNGFERVRQKTSHADNPGYSSEVKPMLREKQSGPHWQGHSPAESMSIAAAVANERSENTSRDGSGEKTPHFMEWQHLKTWQYFKTKMCPCPSRCSAGAKKCRFAHTLKELRPLPDLSRTRLCESLAKNQVCTKLANGQCPFAHSPTELRTSNSKFFKVSLCNFHKAGKCWNGDKCRFAHGLQDLRLPPPEAEAEGAVVVLPDEEFCGDFQKQAQGQSQHEFQNEFHGSLDESIDERSRSHSHPMPSSSPAFRHEHQERDVRLKSETYDSLNASLPGLLPPPNTRSGAESQGQSQSQSSSPSQSSVTLQYLRNMPNSLLAPKKKQRSVENYPFAQSFTPPANAMKGVDRPFTAG